MQLFTLFEPAKISIVRQESIDYTFQGNAPYVISNSYFKMLFENLQKNMFKCTTYDHRIVQFNALSGDKSKPVLLWNGSGGIGDQIMTWPVAYILHRMGYQVHVMVELGLEYCWWHFPWVKGIHSIPCEQSKLEMFTQTAFFESVANFDEHPDQLHPVDTMLTRLGIDPNSVEPGLKKIAPTFTNGEKKNAEDFLGGQKKIGVYQMLATNPVRSLTPEKTVAVVVELSRSFPETAWVCIHDINFQKEPEFEKLNNIPNVKLIHMPSLRILWAVVAMSDVCISPDSMLMHIAGSLDVPCISMWGPLDPVFRSRYYKNQVAIWHKNACPLAPCFVTTKEFPPYCPPLPEPRKTCAVMGAISPEDVVSAVGKFL